MKLFCFVLSAFCLAPLLHPLSAHTHPRISFRLMALNTIYGTTLGFAAMTPKPNCLSALSSRSDRYPWGWSSKTYSYLQHNPSISWVPSVLMNSRLLSIFCLLPPLWKCIHQLPHRLSYRLLYSMSLEQVTLFLSLSFPISKIKGLNFDDLEGPH